MLNFVIPTNRDDLLTCTAGQYHVEEIFSTRLIPVKLQDAKSNLLKGDGLNIHKYFDVIFSVISKFNELDTSIKLLTWNTLTKGCERFCIKLNGIFNDENETNAIWDSNQRESLLTALKMHIYLLIQISELYQSLYRQTSLSNAVNVTGKGKKSSKAKNNHNKLGIEWENECIKAIQLIMNFVDLDIHRLWESQLVEDELTSLISNLCYKILEDQVIMKNKSLKSALFHLLGCIIKKHNQSLSSSLKLVQLMQHFEHVALPLAEAVHLWTTTYKCKSLVAEILRELSHIEEHELMRDSASARTICNFIQELARLLPSEVLSNISLLLSRMDEESYSMRNTVLGVFGEILMQCLNGEGLSEKSRSDRDQFLDIMFDHANLDVNAFVRSKALHVCLDLVKRQVLPIKRCPQLVKLCVGLLLDKSNLVRKATVQLLEGLLRWNPYAGTLPITVLKEGLDEAKLKLKEIQAKNAPKENIPASESQSADDSQNEDRDGEDEDQSENVENNPNQDEDHDDSEGAKQQKIVTYLSDSVCFVERFHEAVPVLCQLLKSRTQSDVLEAISFFTAAWEFKLGFAIHGIAEMLDQIWNEEQKIRDAVVYAYKELYFKQNTSSNNKSHADQVTDNMVLLAAGAGKEKLEAVEALIGEMHKSGDIPSGVAKVLWGRFVNPPSDFTMEHGISEARQQRVVVQLIGMLASSNPQMLTSKIDSLADVGLVEETHPDPDDASKQVAGFELAMHTCTTLLKLAPRKTEAGKLAQQFRLPNDHKVFTLITHLLVTGFSKESNTWIRFAFEASGVIFHLSKKPIPLSTTIFNQLHGLLIEESSKDNPSGVMVDRHLRRFFSICGHFALKLLIFIEGDVLSEIKRKRKLQEEKEEEEKASKKKKKSKRQSKAADKSKNETNLEEELAVEGATADDADQEFIRNVLETEIVGPDSLLGGVSEMLVRTCMMKIDEINVRAVLVQTSAALALGKYMLVSSEFCEKHQRLFFTMLENSPHEAIRANLTICAGDLCIRFPNLLEPWTANIYARLNDKSNLVRVYAIKVLTNLILNDMIKVKGHVSEMAKCIVDENETISTLAKRFFQELSKKGNSVYNVMPDIISRLSDPEVGVKDDVDFKAVMRFLFEYIQKDKQSESLVEKLCHRFKATRDVQQWRDLAYCLSLLNYSERAVKKLMENFSFYSDMLRDEQVYYSFDAILNKSKRFAKPELKLQIEELENKIIDHHAQGVSEDESTAKAAEASKKYKIPRSQSVNEQPGPSVPKKRRYSLVRDLSIPCNKITLSPTLSFPERKRSSSSVGSETSSPSPSKQNKLKSLGNKRGVASVRKIRTRKKRRESFCSDDGIDDADVAVRRSTRNRPGRQKIVVEFSSDDEDNDLNDDAKENIATDFTEDDEDSQISNVITTPIRRKKTPKRSAPVSVLRA